MRHQFKEGDGSHRDMTIEQCNIVLDRLRAQGYKIGTDYMGDYLCDKSFPYLIFELNEFVATSVYPAIQNQILFERWMEILDENEEILRTSKD